jgi:uncharacterized membrane protein
MKQRLVLVRSFFKFGNRAFFVFGWLFKHEYCAIRFKQAPILEDRMVISWITALSP